ncbi:MAG: TniQ family protein [Dermatophilaceae bacterium]
MPQLLADPVQAVAVTGPPPLRTIVGGYDIYRWPIYVPRGDGESLAGWLRRLAHRYGITVTGVLAELGIDHRSQAQPDLPSMVAADPTGFARAGLDPPHQSARCSTIGAALDRLDAHYWSDIRCRRNPRWTRSSRFCPRCLAETGQWAETWQHPYHVACPTHGVLLELRCPWCHAEPFAKPTWLAHDGHPTACHDFIDTPTGKRYRERCGTQLGETPTFEAHPDLMAAQEWLWSVIASAAREEQVTVAGFEVPAATAYEAAAEVITENTLDPRVSDIRFAEEHGIQVAHFLLTQPSLGEAASVAAQIRGFNPQEGVAPIGPLFRVQQRPRNPVLTAIALQQHQGQLTVGAELKFRVGTPAPCYPQAWRVKSSPLTPGSGLADLPMSAIPSTLWPGSVSLGDPELDARHGVDTPLGRAFAAIALARFGSDRGWRLIAVNLGLPAHCASTGARHWYAIDKAGLWSIYVQAISRLFEQLHADPPPINYKRRRITAQPATVQAQARRLLPQGRGKVG